MPLLRMASAPTTTPRAAATAVPETMASSGDHPHVADQQIERAGEEGETERLHEEQRIDEKRRGQQHEHHDGESRDLVTAHPARRRGLDGGRGLARDAHDFSRPNSPVGRTRRTRAMITKITVFDASG